MLFPEFYVNPFDVPPALYIPVVYQASGENCQKSLLIVVVAVIVTVYCETISR